MNHIDRHDQEYLARKIRAQYTQRQRTELDELKALDHRVKAPANGFAYAFGTAAALVLGAGMSLMMTDIGGIIDLTDPMIPGLVMGIAGIFMAAVNYPIYRRILNGRRKKYARQVITLSDRLTEG